LFGKLSLAFCFNQDEAILHIVNNPLKESELRSGAHTKLGMGKVIFQLEAAN
jgi:hypothetical protein